MISSFFQLKTTMHLTKNLKQLVVVVSLILAGISVSFCTSTEHNKSKGNEEPAPGVIPIDMRNTVEEIVGETISMALLMEILLSNNNLSIHGQEPSIVQKHILDRETNIIQSYIYFSGKQAFDSVLYRRKQKDHIPNLLTEQDILNNEHVRYVMEEGRKYIYKETKESTERVVCIIPIYADGTFSGFVKNIAVLK